MLVDVLCHCVAHDEGAAHDPTLAPVLLGWRIDLFIAGFLPLGILPPGRGHGRWFSSLGHRQKESKLCGTTLGGDGEGGPSPVSACPPEETGPRRPPTLIDYDINLTEQRFGRLGHPRSGRHSSGLRLVKDRWQQVTEYKTLNFGLCKPHGIPTGRSRVGDKKKDTAEFSKSWVLCI